MLSEARKALIEKLPFSPKRAALMWKDWQEEARKQRSEEHTSELQSH